MNDYIHELISIYNNMDIFIPSCKELFIYHYTSSQGLQGIIENECLRFSDRNFLNDSSEGTYVLDLLCNNLDFICENRTELKNCLYIKCQQKKDNLINERFHTYQCSFSTDKENLALWNYYTKGDNIKGYNIEFDINKLIKSLTPTGDRDTVLKPTYGKVLYYESKQIRILKQITDAFSDIYEKYPTAISDITDAILDKMILYGKFFKMKCFAIENEYRIVFDTMLMCDMEKAGIPDKEHFREIHGYYIPYIKKNISLETIKSVSMSPTLDDKLTKASLTRLFFNRGVKIDIQKSSIPVRY